MEFLNNLLINNMDMVNILISVLVFILADTFMGWFLALKTGTFDLALVPQFLKNNVFPYMGALIMLAVLGLVSPEIKGIFFIIAGLVALKFGKEAILEKGKALILAFQAE